MYYICRICVCSLIHPACKAHALYLLLCHLLPSISRVFFHIISYAHFFSFKKALLNLSYDVCFPLQLFSQIFIVLRRTQRAVIITAYRSSCTVHIVLVQYTLFWYSTHSSGTVHIVLVQYTLFWYSTHYSYTAHIILVQFAFFLYSTHFCCTVNIILVQYTLFLYSIHCSCTVHIILIQYTLFSSDINET
jgi:hypothetical protein